jgi:radical SAM protein with 4Fe4S-binding SPASM domain
MPVDTWKKVVRAIVEHTRMRRARLRASSLRRDARVHTLIVFHGGEPFVLPEVYLREILEALAEATRGEPDVYQLCVQTNLLSIPEDKLKLFLAHKVHLSISFDKRPGVRLNVAGQATEATVASNIDRLLARGIRLTGIAVLAKHTADHVCEVYDFYAARRMPMRILPLFDGPEERSSEAFALDRSHIVRSLERLFQHWVETGCAVPLAPLQTHFEAALRHLAGLRITTWQRAEHGDSVFVVNLDTKVYRTLDAYQEQLALGDLSRQSIGELLGSPSYERSLERDAQDFDSKCRGCEYLGACSAGFIHDTRVSSHEGRCPTAYSSIQFIQRYVQEQGYGREELAELIAQLASASRPEAA